MVPYRKGRAKKWAMICGSQVFQVSLGKDEDTFGLSEVSSTKENPLYSQSRPGSLNGFLPRIPAHPAQEADIPENLPGLWRRVGTGREGERSRGGKESNLLEDGLQALTSEDLMSITALSTR